MYILVVKCFHLIINTDSGEGGLIEKGGDSVTVSSTGHTTQQQSPQQFDPASFMAGFKAGQQAAAGKGGGSGGDDSGGVKGDGSPVSLGSKGSVQPSAQASTGNASTLQEALASNAGQPGNLTSALQSLKRGRGLTNDKAPKTSASLGINLNVLA